MAGFDLKAHITGHAHTTHDGLPDNFNLQSYQNTHFTLSFDKSQFILNHNTTNQKEIDNIMSAFFEDLKKEEYLFQESNGKNKAPRTRMLDLSNTLMAYHNSSSEAMNNYDVYDHIHLLIPGQLKNSKGQSTKLGSSYMHLRQLISNVAERHNLVPNFDEATEFEKDKDKKKSATNFSWYLKKATEQTFIASINNGNLLKSLSKIEDAYKKGNTTLDHLFKSYIDLQYRLDKLDIDLIDEKGKNLRYDFPIHINQKQKDEIAILKSGDKEKITELIQNRNSKITRACIEQSFGFNSVVYDALQNRANLLNDIDLNLIRKIANNPSVKVVIKKKDKNAKQWEKSLSYHVKNDIETVLKYSTNEKTFRENLKEIGYQNLKIISKDKQKIGLSFINPHNDKMATIYFNQINMSMPQITKQLIENKQLFDKGLLSQKPQLNYKDSFLSKYIPRELDPQIQKQKKKIQDIQFEKIYGKTPAANLAGYYITESKILKKGTFIDVQDNKITVKHQNIAELEKNVSIIIETAIAKGWNLSNLKIKGTTQFKLAVQAELKRRENNKLVKIEKAVNNTKVDIKVKDIDILKQLKALNLNNYSIDEKEKEYGQVWDIMDRAVKSKNIDLLNACYDTLEYDGIEELKLKLINYAKVLNVSSGEINKQIGIGMGLKDNEIDLFIDNIKSINNYDEKFLDSYIQKLDEKLSDYYVINQDLDDDKLDLALIQMQKLHKDFHEFKKKYITKKEYVNKIKNIDEHLENGRFYSSKKLINELDNFDKIIYENKYNDTIDLAAELSDFDKIKDEIDKQNQLEENTYFAENNEQQSTDKKANDYVQKEINKKQNNNINYHRR